MKSCPNKAHIRKAREIAAHVSALKIPIYASYTSYFMVLSVFPTLVLLLSLLRYSGLQVDTLTGFLDGFLPAALMPSIEKLILSTYYNSTGVMISFSAATALWSASRGMYGLLTGLNSVYKVSENRGYLFTRTISVFYTFLFLLVLLLTLILHVFGNSLLAMFHAGNSHVLDLLTKIVQSRFLTLLFVQTILFTAIFMALPNRRNSLKESLPGALLASLGWLLFSKLYSIYVEHVTIYTTIYGSVYAVALSMLWLYCCLSIVFYGGALNHYLSNRKNKG